MFHWAWLTTLSNSPSSLDLAADDGPTDAKLDEIKLVTPLPERIVASSDLSGADPSASRLHRLEEIVSTLDGQRR